MAANFNFNKATIGGRLTASPEVKQTQSGVPVCSFTVAVNRKANREETDFISCVAWRNTAEFIGKYFSKGSSICVTGAIQTRNWTDSNGQKRYTTEIIVDEAYFVDGKGEGNTTEQTYIPEAYQPTEANLEVVNDDLPF